MIEFIHLNQLRVSSIIHTQRFSIIFNLKGDSPVIIECEFCRQRCAQNDYKTHRVFHSHHHYQYLK